MKAILTGHSRGLGAALAEELLQRNFSVLGIARSKNADLAKRFPDALQQVEVDLANAPELESWLAGSALREFIGNGKTVLLINNAGTPHPFGPIEKQDVSTVAQAIGLNIAAPMMLTAAVAAAAVNAGAADTRILHISSGAGRKDAYPCWSIYCASKAALDHHARAVAQDKTPHLRICSLAPGVIDTDMQTAVRTAPVEEFPLKGRFEGLKRDGQLISPQDGARKVLDYMLHDQFGQTPVADLREVGK